MIDKIKASAVKVVEVIKANPKVAAIVIIVLIAIVVLN